MAKSDEKSLGGYINDYASYTVEKLFEKAVKKVKDTTIKTELKDAYDAKNYEEVSRLFEKACQDRTKNDSYNTQEVKKGLGDEKGGLKKIMGWLIPAGIAAILFVAFVVFWFMSKKRSSPDDKVSSILDLPSSKKEQQIQYTKKDEDFLELMHLLAVALKKTDNF